MKPATKKKLAIALGILVLLAIIASLLLPKLIDPNRYHNRIVSEIEKALGGRVQHRPHHLGYPEGPLAGSRWS